MRSCITRPFISVLIAVALLATIPLFSPVASARVGSNRPSGGSATAAATLAGYIPTAVTGGQARLIGQHRGTDSLALTIGLPLRNQPALTRLLQEVSTPGSALYRHYLTQAQANQAFNPTPQQERQVISWLRSHGLRVTHTFPNHLLVDVTGSVAQVERLLHVTINDYTTQVDGKQATFYAPANNPTIDASVKNIISTIAGLNDYPRFHSDASLAAPRPADNGTADDAPPYYPQDFADAYDVNPLWDAGDTGAGQHIGIVLWAPAPSDTALTLFAAQTGADVATQANGRLQVIPVDGGPQYSAGTLGAAEAAMDVEYTSGMAPGATIDYYAAPNTAQGDSTDTGLEDALNQAGSDANNNAQISNSWGLCEAADPTFVTATEQILQSNIVTGHNYFFSSGDYGSTCVPTPDKQCTHTDPTPQYPASSAYVTSVGGTTFDANVNGGYPGEMTWRYPWHCSVQFNRPRGSSQNPPGGSGGGYSQLFAQPGWQVDFSANQYRGYPDVAADADPATGAYICYDDPQQGSLCSNPGIVGNGASLATPIWAGMIADVDQYVQAQGELPLGFVNPLLYTLTSNASPYLAYHDMRAGTNGNYNAGPGWDAVTGLGSPDLYNLARDAASFDVVSASGNSELRGIAAVSANDVWAVGYYFDANNNQDPLIEHWNGSSWNLVPSTAFSGPSVLYDVAAVSANDVWAVGSVEDSQFDLFTLIEHWNGSSWKVVPGANIPPTNRFPELSGVTVVSANDVWAVGSYASVSGGNQTLIEHWNGSIWTIVPSPSPNPSGTNPLFSVSAVSANDVWAVGWYQDSSGNGDTLVEHWNGSAWIVVPSPGAGPNGQEGSLSSVAAVSASDVWAVGGGLVEHWDGSAWTMVSSPNPSPYGAATLFGVAAVSANDIWAAGWYEDSAGGKDGTLVERWDGSAWTVVLSPNPSSLQNFLFSTAVVSASDVWAVGSYGVATNGYETLFPLIEHWDGSSWNVVPNP